MKMTRKILRLRAGHHAPAHIHKYVVHFAAQHDMADDESFQHEITLDQVDEGRRLYQNYIKKRSVRQYVPARADIPCSPDDELIDNGGNTVDDHDYVRAVTQADPPFTLKMYENAPNLT